MSGRLLENLNRAVDKVQAGPSEAPALPPVTPLQDLAREWRVTQRSYPAQRNGTCLLVTPEQFDEALAEFHVFVMKKAGLIPRR